MPTVAFVGHLDGVTAYREALTALRGDDLPAPTPEAVRQLVDEMAPMPVCDLELHSIRGTSCRATFIDAFLIVEGLRRAVRKVEEAVAEVVAVGARVAALGGFTSIIGERAGVAWPTGPAFTTGNALTAAVLAAQSGRAAGGPATIAVVGAPGDVGSGLVRLLVEDGHTVLAVGRNPRRLAALVDELPVLHPMTWDEAAPRADVVVLVASTEAGAIAVDQVADGVPILDAGHPPNAQPGHLGTVVAGRMIHERPPTGGIPAFTSHNCAPGEHHACLCEAEVLGLEGRYEAWSSGRGNITCAAARQILAWAEAHGIHPATPRPP